MTQFRKYISFYDNYFRLFTEIKLNKYVLILIFRDNAIFIIHFLNKTNSCEKIKNYTFFLYSTLRKLNL
jgi:succinate dehydrogenase flavin-adding protein (antitoxin of CptAB toxin-antitoxin module)